MNKRGRQILYFSFVVAFLGIATFATYRLGFIKISADTSIAQFSSVILEKPNIQELTPPPIIDFTVSAISIEKVTLDYGVISATKATGNTSTIGQTISSETKNASFSLPEGTYNFSYENTTCNGQLSDATVNSQTKNLTIPTTCSAPVSASPTPVATNTNTPTSKKGIITGAVSSRLGISPISGAMLTLNESVAIRSTSAPSSNYRYAAVNIEDGSITVSHPDYEPQTKSFKASDFKNCEGDTCYLSLNFLLVKKLSSYKGDIYGMVFKSGDKAKVIPDARIVLNNKIQTISTGDYKWNNFSFNNIKIEDSTLTVYHDQYETLSKTVKASDFSQLCDATRCYVFVELPMKEKTENQVAISTGDRFDAYLYLKDSEGNPVDQTAKLDIEIRNLNTAETKKSSVSAWNQLFDGKIKEVTGQYNAVVPEIPTGGIGKTSTYQIKLTDPSGNSPYDIVNIAPTFSSRDLSKVTIDGRDQYYFYKEIVVNRRSVVDITGMATLEGSNEIAGGANLELVCGKTNIAKTTSLASLISGTGSNGTPANYIFKNINPAMLKSRDCKIITASEEAGALSVAGEVLVNGSATFVDGISKRSIIKHDISLKIDNSQADDQIIIAPFEIEPMYRFDSTSPSGTTQNTANITDFNYKVVANSGNASKIVGEGISQSSILKTNYKKVENLGSLSIVIEIKKTGFKSKALTLREGDFKQDPDNKNQIWIKDRVRVHLDPTKSHSLNICVNGLKDSQGELLQSSYYKILNGDIDNLGSQEQMDDASAIFPGTDDRVKASIKDGELRINFSKLPERAGDDKWSLFIYSSKPTFPISRALLIDSNALTFINSLSSNDANGNVLCTTVDSLSSFNKNSLNYKNEPHNNNFIFAFYDGKTGKPIKIEEEFERVGLSDLFADAVQSTTHDERYVISQAKKHDNILELTVPKIFTESGEEILPILGLDISFKNYIFLEKNLAIANAKANSPTPVSVYLMGKTNPELYLEKKVVNGVMFYTLKQYALTSYANVSALEKTAAIVRDISDNTNNGTPLIYIPAPGYISAFASGKTPDSVIDSIRQNFAPISSVDWILLTDEQLDSDTLAETVVEYQMSRIAKTFGRNNQKISQQTYEQNLETVYRAILANECHTESGFGGSDIFSMLGDENKYEMWASFMSWWYLRNDELEVSIGSQSPLKESYKCQNLLRFMKVIVEITYPNLKPISQTKKITKINSKASEIILSASGGTQTKDVASFGYTYVNPTAIKTIGNPISIAYSASEIEQGLFIESNFNAADTSAKASIKFKSLAGAIRSSTASQIDRAVQAYNKWYEGITKSTSKNTKTGSLNITLTDQFGFKLNDILINVANKAVRTNSNGLGKISGIPDGSYYLSGMYDTQNQMINIISKSVNSGELIKISASKTTNKNVKISMDVPTVALEVKDKNGKVVPKAKLMLKSSGKTIQIDTDDSGKAIVNNVPSGIKFKIEVFSPNKILSKTIYRKMLTQTSEIFIERSASNNLVNIAVKGK